MSQLSPEITTSNKTPVGESISLGYDTDTVSVKKPTDMSIDSIKQRAILGSESFNEADFSCMLVNPLLNLSVRKIAKYMDLDGPMYSYIRDLLTKEEYHLKSTQILISKISSEFPGLNLDTLKRKFDYYKVLNDEEDLAHFLKILNTRIKKDAFRKFAQEYFDKEDIDSFINSVDSLNENSANAIISFRSLDQITQEELEGNTDPENLLYSSSSFVNKLSTTGALGKAQLVVVAGPPGRGKTSFLMNEAYEHAKNGKSVAYLALGDMMESDFLIKIGMMHFKVDQFEFIRNIQEYYKDPVFNKIKSKLRISVVNANSVSSSEVVSVFNIDDVLTNSDVAIFDYDSNFSELVNYDMYKAHEIIYNTIYKYIKKDPIKLGYIASQVKLQYFNWEILPLESLAESTRKQAIADLVITINSIRSETLNTGIINVPKFRRGSLGHTHFSMDKSGRLLEISKSTYNSIRSQITLGGE